MGEMGRMGLRVRFTVWFRVVAGTRGGRDAWLDGTRRVVGWVAVTQSPCHLVTLSPSHPVTQSPCHPIQPDRCFEIASESDRLTRSSGLFAS